MALCLPIDSNLGPEWCHEGIGAFEYDLEDYHCNHSFLGILRVESAALNRRHTDRAIAGNSGRDCCHS